MVDLVTDVTRVISPELDERGHLLKYPQYPYYMLCSSLVPSHIYGVIFISLGMNLLLRNCYENCYD